MRQRVQAAEGAPAPQHSSMQREPLSRLLSRRRRLDVSVSGRPVDTITKAAGISRACSALQSASVRVLGLTQTTRSSGTANWASPSAAGRPSSATSASASQITIREALVQIAHPRANPNAEGLSPGVAQKASLSGPMSRGQAGARPSDCAWEKEERGKAMIHENKE